MAANNNQEDVPDATIGTDVQIFPSDSHSAQASELSVSIIPDQPEVKKAQDMTKTNGSTGIEEEQDMISETNESTGNKQTQNIVSEGTAQGSEEVTEGQDNTNPELFFSCKEKTPKGQEASTANAGENEAPAKITDHPIVKEAQEIISNLKETQETDPNSNEPEKIKEKKKRQKK